jgi:hypothetical protein
MELLAMLAEEVQLLIQVAVVVEHLHTIAVVTQVVAEAQVLFIFLFQLLTTQALQQARPQLQPTVQTQL